jgi:hypothetical protein
MKNPLILLDFDNKKIIIVFKNAVSYIDFADIDKKEDFLDEVYKRYKNFNIVNKYSEIDRKTFVQLLEDLTKKEKEEKIEEINKEVEKKHVEEIKEDNKENSTLIRCAIGKRIAIEDLGIRFNTPYDYFDLSTINNELVGQSNQLKHFLKNGIVVKTSYKEIEDIKNKCFAEQKKKEELRNKKDIVDKRRVLSEGMNYSEDDSEMGDDEEDENLISSGANELPEEGFSDNIRFDSPEDMTAGSLVSDFFSERGEKILEDGLDQSLKGILRTLKK